MPGQHNLPHGQTILNLHNGHPLQQGQAVNNRGHQQQQLLHQQQQQQQYQNLEVFILFSLDRDVECRVR